MTGFERRCRWLLRAYPASYRAERGDEILGTLLEASSPDRSWPAARDARALIVGGLRVRAWQHQRQTAASALSQAVLFAAVLDLALWSTAAFAVAGELGYTMLGLLTLAAMAGAWFSHRALVAVLALAAAGLWVYQPSGDLLSVAVQPVLALALLAILVLRRNRLPGSWVWLAGVWYLAYLAADIFGPVGVIGYVGLWAQVGFVVGAIGWSVIDARPMLAITLAVAVYNGVAIASRWYLRPGLVQVVVALALAAAAVWQVRRQAVL